MALFFAALTQSAFAKAVSDRSQNGALPDSNGNGIATDNNDPTPVNYSSTARSGIQLAASEPREVDGKFLVTLEMLVANYSDVQAQFQVQADLARAFPDTPVKIVSVSSEHVALNSRYDGYLQKNVLPDNITFDVFEAAIIKIELEINPLENYGPFSLSFETLAIGPHNQGPDQSDFEHIDKNDNGDPTEPGENRPTIITLPKRGCTVEGQLFYDANHDAINNDGFLADGDFCAALSSQTREYDDVTVVDSGAYSFDNVLPDRYAVSIGKIKDGFCELDDNIPGWNFTSDSFKQRVIQVRKSCDTPSVDFGLFDGLLVYGIAFSDSATPRYDKQYSEQEKGIGEAEMILRCDGRECARFKADIDGFYQGWLRYAEVGRELAVTTQPDGYLSLQPDGAKAVVTPTTEEVRLDVAHLKRSSFGKDTVGESACSGQVIHRHSFNAAASTKVSFEVLTASVDKHPVKLHIDANCDGDISAQEAELEHQLADDSTGTRIPATICTVTTVGTNDCAADHAVEIEIAANVEHPSAGVTDQLTAKAMSKFTAVRGQSKLDIRKTLRNVTKGDDGAVAEFCDVLEYGIYYRVIGGSGLEGVNLSDITAVYTTLYKLPACSEGNPCTPSIVEGGVGQKSTLRWKFNETLPPGKEGSVVYQVQVNGSDCKGPTP